MIFDFELFLLEKKWEKDVENSSNIAKIEWDSETKILTVEFLSGSKYEYYKVPEKTFQYFADENYNKKVYGTYGTRFWKKIRRGPFKFKKIK